MIKVRYRRKRLEVGFVTFVFEIFVWKVLLVVVDKLRKSWIQLLMKWTESFLKRSIVSVKVDHMRL